MVDKSLPPTPRSNKAPELYMVNGIEAYHSDEPELFHQLHDTGLQRAGDQGKYVTERESCEKEPAEPAEPALARRRILRVWAALAVLILIAAAIGGGVGGALGRRNASSPSPAASTPTSSVPTGPPWNASASLTKSSATPADWRGKAVYQVLTDRFGRTDQSTTAPCDPAVQGYCGGTWKGIINKLDYIQNMGFTAIWISPVTAQMTQNTSDGEAYHGYWQQNIYELNSNFGTAQDLQALSTAVHSRNMFLMVDVVVNHFASAGDPSMVDYTSFYPFNDTSFFHPYCPITPSDYTSNQHAVENCWLGDTAVTLPDLNTQDHRVIETYYSWIQDLVSTFGIDGLRIDTVKHVQQSFWPGFNSAAGVYCLGEVLDGDSTYTCPYQSSLDGVLNYPLYFALINAFQNSTGDMTVLNATISAINSSCKDTTLLGTFIENHDNPRFPSLTSDLSPDKNAIAFVIMADGIPIIYEGQEQRYFGASVPHNREAVWLADYSPKSTLYSFIGSVNQIRNQEIYKSPSYLTERMQPIYTDRNNIALRKGKIVSVYTNLGANSTDYTLSLSGTGYAANQSLVEILSCGNVTVGADGNLGVGMSQGLPRIFCPLTELMQSGICYL